MSPMQSRKVTFHLSITREKCLRYYTGDAKYVVVTADDGRNVQFPAERLREFMTQDGVQGRFLLEFDAANRITRFERTG